MEGVDRIGEAALFAHLLEKARGHAAPRRRREHMRGVVIGRNDPAPLERDDQMGLLQRLLQQRLAAGVARRDGGLGLRSLERGKLLLHELDEAFMVEGARADHQRHTGPIIALQISLDRLAPKA